MRRGTRVLLSLVVATGLAAGLGSTAAFAGTAPKAVNCAGKTKKKAIKQIKKTWDIFLNGTAGRTLEERKVVVQGADDPALFDLFNSVFAANAEIAAITSTDVQTVTCTGKKTADVTFLLVNTQTGDPLLPDAQAGDAVIDDGIWKVSTLTVCDLVALAGASGGPCVAA